MINKLKSQISYLAIGGMLAAVAFVSGCSGMNDTPSSVSGEIGGPTVPFDISIGGETAGGEWLRNQDGIKFDATAPQDGSFDGTWTTETDTATSTCTFDCLPANSMGGRCYTPGSEEVGGTTGHSIEINIVPATTLAAAAPDTTHTDRYISCAVTSGTSCTANCTGFVPNNTVTLNDSFMMNTIFDEQVTSDSLGTSGGIRLAYYVGRDEFGESKFSQVGGTVSYDTTGSLVPISVYSGLTPDYDISVDANGDQSAEIMYSLDAPPDSNLIQVLAYVPSSYPLKTTPQSGIELNGIVMWCSEIDVCPALLPTETYATLMGGTSIITDTVSSVGVDTVGTQTVTFKNATTNLGEVARWDGYDKIWTIENISGTDPINAISAIDYSSYSWIERSLYTKIDGTGAVSRYDMTNSVWEPYATITDIIDQASIASDGSDGLHVAYLDANGLAKVQSYDDVNYVWTDRGLETALTATLPAYQSTVNISNLAYDSLSGGISIAVAWVDDSGSRSLSVMEWMDLAWIQKGADNSDPEATTAGQLFIKSTGDATYDAIASWTDVNGAIYAALFDTQTREWFTLDAPADVGFTSVDTINRTSIAFYNSDGATPTTYLVVKDTNDADALKVIRTSPNKPWAVEAGIERAATSNASISMDSGGLALTVAYRNTDDGLAYAKQKDMGGR